MQLPKFLMGDHADFMDDIFIIHTEFPRFILNLVTDEVMWMEDIANEDAETLSQEMAQLIAQAEVFYDEQVEKYESQ